MNPFADVIMGGGGMPGSINQRPYPFAAFGRGAFRDPETVLVALAAAGGAVHAWRPLEDPNGERLELIDGRGFNAIAGGGGRFAALMVPRAPAPPVLFGSLGDKTGAGAADVAPDGTIVYKTSYHAERGLTIVDPSGGVVELPDALPVDVQALDGGRAVWRGGAHGRAPLRPHLADAMNTRLAENVRGVDVLAYWSNAAGALVVEYDGTGLGYMFFTENGFDHDLIALDGAVILAASRTAGEGPGDLVKISISPAGLRYLVPANGEAPPWFPAAAYGPIELPIPPLRFPTFAFSHPVSVYPFRAEGSGRPDVFTIGTYSENPTPPSPLPKGRLLLAHDSPADWTIPAGALRSYDAVGWELYRVEGETLEQSGARWIRQARANLAQWPRDCFVIPMFYNQFNPATGAWLWTDQEVLDGLEYLDQVVNLDPRIKFVAPFSFDRANGIKPNPNLSRAFNDLKVAAALAGEATLTPVPPEPPDPPKPDPSLYYKPKEYAMSTGEEIGAIKIADRFARIVLAGENRGPFGWWEVLFDRTTPDDDCWFTLSKPDTRHSIIHTKIPVLLGADQKEAEDPFFYGKPTSLPDARGILESPVVIKDPASDLIVVYWTWPNRHATGGTSSPSATWIKRAS